MLPLDDNDLVETFLQTVPDGLLTERSARLRVHLSRLLADGRPVVLTEEERSALQVALRSAALVLDHQQVRGALMAALDGA